MNPVSPLSLALLDKPAVVQKRDIGESFMGHTYEEIRNVVIDILIGREKVNYSPDQYANLLIDVGEVFQRREGLQNSPSMFRTESSVII